LKELITKNLEVKDKFNYESHKTVDSYENIFLSNIKFLLNIQIYTFNTKHTKQILVILFKSQYEIRLEI